MIFCECLSRPHEIQIVQILLSFFCLSSFTPIKLYYLEPKTFHKNHTFHPLGYEIVTEASFCFFTNAQRISEEGECFLFSFLLFESVCNR